MEALLSSPSSYSPPTSPTSSSPGSPQFPDLGSPFSATPSTNYYHTAPDDTPTRSTSRAPTAPLVPPTPTWLTDELDEEWIDHQLAAGGVQGESGDSAESDASSADDEEYHGSVLEDMDETDELAGQEDDDESDEDESDSVRRLPASIAPHPLQSLNKPRVPSSLRFAFSTSSTTTTSTLDLTSTSNLSVFDHPPPVVDPTSPVQSSEGAGTFIVRDVPPSGLEEESQLQAAVRALNGGVAHGGLGAADVEDGLFDIPIPGKGAAKGDRLGLRNLFDQPPPSPLPSTLPSAPSAATFDFTPPPPSSPKKSWKQLAHFTSSPALGTPGTPETLTDLTPRPSKKPVGEAPELRAKERFLRSSAVEAMQTVPLPVTPAKKTPADPPPTPASAHKLFEFKYDTFTRNHLTALVDEIDGLASGERSYTHSQAGEVEFVEVGLEGDKEQDGISEGEEEGGRRAGKRIRISPSPSESRRGQQSSTPPRPRTSTTGRRRFTRRSSPSPADPPQPQPYDDIWQLAASSSSPPPPEPHVGISPALPLPFATELDQSAQLISLVRSPTPPPPASDANTSSRASSPSPLPLPAPEEKQTGPAPISDVAASIPAITASTSTRDRLSEANALLNRIRVRTSAKEQKTKATATATLPLSPTEKSTRKLPESGDVEPDILGDVEPDGGELIGRLEKKARESLRSVLSSQVGTSEPHFRTPSGASFAGSVAQGLDSATPRGKRHFARTPVGSISMLPSLPPPSTTRRGTGDEPPQHARHRSITTIGPGDVELLLASVGRGAGGRKMVFDRDAGRWIKSAKRESDPSELFERSESTSTEEDPFRDFDNTATMMVRDGEGLSGLGITAGTPQVASSPLDKNHFLVDPVERHVEDDNEDDSAAWGKVGDVPASHEDAPTMTTNGDEATDTVGFTEESPFHLFQELQDLPASPPPPPLPPTVVVEGERSRQATALLPPDIAEPLQISVSETPVVAPIPVTPRPALPTVPPRSALKTTPGRPQSAPATLLTPLAAVPLSGLKPPRSVSFTDGKRSGPIEGLVVKSASAPPPPQLGSRLKFEPGGLSTASIGLFGEPGSLELMEPVDNGAPPETSVFGSPTSIARTSTRTKAIEKALDELQTEGREPRPISPETSIVIGSFESALKVRPKSLSRSTTASNSRTFRRTTSLDATSMTECSFGVATDRLVQFITDVEPFEPDWEGVRSIDLSRKAAESMMKLKEFLPNLDEVDLSHNELAFLTGLPSTIRLLLLSFNKISSLTSFAHLRNLERLDISNNQIDSVDQFSCLVHLRELKADDNRISDLGGLADIDGLVRLSLKGNRIESLDFGVTRWTRLETLNLSHNLLTELVNLDRLPSLSLLNLDHNLLASLPTFYPLLRLRVLRISSNPISRLDISFAPRLRTLFVDSAGLGILEGTERLRKLENLSLRDQGGSERGAFLSMPSVRDIRRLYLSGNPLPSFFATGEKFFNLTFLELALCSLTALPPSLSSSIPNVRILNLNFNALEDLESLAGLGRLERLSAIGNRVARYRETALVLSGMEELKELDLRMNPLTLAFYPPLVLPSNPAEPAYSEYQILRPSQQAAPSLGVLAGDQYAKLDAKFRRALPDQFYLKRMSYRALVLKSCHRVSRLDGLEVGQKDRTRLAAALGGLPGQRVE